MKTGCENLEQQLQLVESQIRDQLFCFGDGLGDLVGCVTDARGKMLRPKVFLLCSQLASEIGDDHFRLAAVVEMIHMATLLHDDVIDNADLRRQQPTVNSLYGNERAVLMGDYVLAGAFMISSRLNSPDVQYELSQMTARICRGEILQDIKRGDFSLSRQEYISIITDKTACFFETVARLGSVLAGDEEYIGSLGKFGLNLGLAFQIRDDVLDIIGSRANQGKTLGTDADGAKLTLPMIHFFENADRQAQDDMLNLIKAHEDFSNLLRDSGSLDFAISQLDKYCEVALQPLNDLPSGDAVDQLCGIVQRLGEI